MRRPVAFRYNNVMHFGTRSSSWPVVMAAAVLVGCAPPTDRPASQDGGRDASEAGDAGDAGTDGARGDGSDGAAAGTPTYTKDIQPIFKMKCAPCHDGLNLGKHDIASSYADALKPVPSSAQDATGCWKDPDMTMPKTIGECAAISIKRGWMPYQRGCDRPMPDDPSACPSADQIALVEKWVAAGMPE